MRFTLNDRSGNLAVGNAFWLIIIASVAIYAASWFLVFKPLIKAAIGHG